MKRTWFLPATLDVIGLLRAQAAVTIEGIGALVEWAGGDDSGAERVREREHAADDRKRELFAALTESFTTPVDAEDLYMMSKHLDDVMNGAKDAVRECEVMALRPDEHVGKMATSILEGVRHVDDAFRLLRPDAARMGRRPRRPTQRSSPSGDSNAHYRHAMSALLEVDDLREVMGRRELYRRFSRIGDSVIEAAERVWYSTLKEG